MPQEKLQYHIETQGKVLQDLTPEALVRERDKFTHWVDVQEVDLKNADRAFKNAFKVAIQGKLGNTNFLPDQVTEAFALLEHGFYHPPRVHGKFAHQHGDTAQGGKGRG